jgi:lipopolysaccharide export system protein LptA
MSGSGLGATYDKNTDVLTLLDKAAIRVAADEHGAGRLEADAGGARLVRTDHQIHLERRVTIRQDSGEITADSAVAHLAADESAVESLDLRGGARLTGSASGAGTFKEMTATEIDLRYAAGLAHLEQAAMRGGATIDVTADGGQAARQIAARTIDVTLAPDGTTPTALTARDRVRLTLPGTRQDPARTITADAMDGRGNAQQGLTGSHFAGRVQLVERGGGVQRTARSASLDVALGKGFSSIEEARFAGGVRFEEGAMTATAAAARYVLAAGALELTGGEPGAASPRLVNERMDTSASRIDVTLEGPQVHAAGRVQSTLKPPPPGASGSKDDDTRVPAMLKPDQEISVTAADLVYDGHLGRARYTGNAVLFQGATRITAGWIAMDDRSGNLSAGEGVTTAAVMVQEGKDGKRERVASTGSSRDFTYEDAARKAIYTGEARLVGPQGDVRAATIALFLKPSGDEIDRAEAQGNVSVVDDKKRKSTGDALQYFSAEERYQLQGKPVVIVDQCGRPTDGLSLTFFKASDRIILNGTPQNLTRTRSDGSACP